MVTSSKQSEERKVLQISIYISALFSVFGIAWGFYIDSQMVIFDGFYSSVSVALTWFSLWVAKEVTKSEDELFPFGRSQLEPVLIVFKATVIIALCLVSLAGAVRTLLEGGNYTDPGRAMVYAVLSTASCIGTLWYIKKSNRSIGSELLRAEKDQFLGDTLLSSGVLAGFLIAWIFKDTSQGWIAQYADPVMVVIASLLFLPAPARSLLRNLREILHLSADPQLVEQARGIIQSHVADFPVTDFRIRVIKLGRELTIEIDFLLPDADTRNLADLDRFRLDLMARLNKLPYRKWYNFSFTGSEEWFNH